MKLAVTYSKNWATVSRNTTPRTVRHRTVLAV